MRQFYDEQFADGADPIPKAAYKEAADKDRIAREGADQRIRELEAERDDWRARTQRSLNSDTVSERRSPNMDAMKR